MHTEKFLIPSLVLTIALSLNGCSGGHKFQGVSFEPGRDVTLRGKLYKPDGDGPFPAVVVLHGCGGINDLHRIWAARLKNWGYVAMVVDSHAGRGITNNCGYPRRVTALERALDAHSAKSYIAKMPFVDELNIGVIGFSKGGETVLRSVDTNFVLYSVPEDRNDPFKAAIALYPTCGYSFEVNAPIMVLIGEKDDWNPAKACLDNAPKSSDALYDVIVKVYPGAHHGFDYRGRNIVYKGHVLRYNHEAASDAEVQVRTFFERHMKQ